MIFLEFVLENFGPYAGRQTINLRTDNNTNCPIILFGGMNGGGKTTLMDAMRLALYGQRAQCSTRGNLSYKDFLSQCVNKYRYNDKTRIELEFEIIEDGKRKYIRVVRYWHLHDDKDTLGILISENPDDEKWQDVALTNIWDEYIESILPLGISNLFLFDGEQVKELAELDTPPTQVITAIDSLLGLELAEKLAQDLDILLSRKRKEINTSPIQLETLEKIEQKLLEQNRELTELEEQKITLEKQVKQAVKAQKNAMDRFIYEGGKIASDRSQLQKEKLKLEEELESIREQMRELVTGSFPLNMILPLVEKSHLQLDKELRIKKEKIAINVMKERDQRLLDYITNIDLSQDYLSKIQEFLTQENQQIEEEIRDFSPYLEGDEVELNHLEELLKYELKYNRDLGDSQLGILQKLERQIEFLERQIAAAAAPEAYQKLELTLTEANDHLAQIKSEFEIASSNYTQLEKRIKKTKRELEKYTDDSLKLMNNQHLIDSMAKVKSTLKIFKEKLTKKKLNKLENEVTECFRYLLHKIDLVNKVVIDTETYGLLLYDKEGKPLQKHRLSAGEKQLLAVAFLWGLARVAGRNLPVAIDTPLGRLDSSHRNNLIERYFPAASHQVILLSTDTEITAIEVQKLREQEAIAREYLLRYDANEKKTVIENGYFW
jgi:DNA sulfur modification protein DndD